MVCMGNICRSPTAEAVFRKLAKDARLPVQVDSAGTIGFHQGKTPDPRALSVGHARGYNFEQIHSRRVVVDDFYAFDLLLAMDQANFQDLLSLCPEPHLTSKVKLLLDYSEHFTQQEVPDPYYGGQRGFELVLDLIEDACQGLVTHIQRTG